MNDSKLSRFELHFQPFASGARGYAFPCDPMGRVDLNQLSNRGRNDYLFARGMIGRELNVPAVRPCGIDMEPGLQFHSDGEHRGPWLHNGFGELSPS